MAALVALGISVRAEPFAGGSIAADAPESWAPSFEKGNPGQLRLQGDGKPIPDDRLYIGEPSIPVNGETLHDWQMHLRETLPTFFREALLVFEQNPEGGNAMDTMRSKVFGRLTRQEFDHGWWWLARDVPVHGLSLNFLLQLTRSDAVKNKARLVRMEEAATNFLDRDNTDGLGPEVFDEFYRLLGDFLENGHAEGTRDAKVIAELRKATRENIPSYIVPQGVTMTFSDRDEVCINLTFVNAWTTAKLSVVFIDGKRVHCGYKLTEEELIFSGAG